MSDNNTTSDYVAQSTAKRLMLLNLSIMCDQCRLNVKLSRTNILY